MTSPIKKIKDCLLCGLGVAFMPTPYDYCWNCRDIADDKTKVVPFEEWIPF